MTVEEVAQMLSVSPQFVRDHATRREPRLQVVRLGSLLRFRREDVTAFIEARLEVTPWRRRRSKCW